MQFAWIILWVAVAMFGIASGAIAKTAVECRAEARASIMGPTCNMVQPPTDRPECRVPSALLMAVQDTCVIDAASAPNEKRR